MLATVTFYMKVTPAVLLVSTDERCLIGELLLTLSPGSPWEPGDPCVPDVPGRP